MRYLAQQAEALLFQLSHIGGMGTWADSELFGHADVTTVQALLESASSFAGEFLVPLATSGDREGCHLHDGRVSLPSGSVDVFRQWVELGFPALGLPQSIDGLGLPSAVQSAVQELCDGANLSMGMLFINLRCAALALLKSATADQQQRWLPGIMAGTLATTIAISEPQAGSDVGRIRTQAAPQPDGSFRLSGSKIWISYADHDATGDILHLALARLPDGETGSRGLSLFAAPKLLDGKHNGVEVLRLEHKMGLHASPTCVLEFTNARAELIGEPGKGLAALFVMMNAMRLAVAVQGSAVANATTLQALAYAAERPQGGHPLSPPVNIIEHVDVQRMLLEMTAESELMRALSLRIAAMLDKAEQMSTRGDTEATQWQRLAELILPVAKTYNAETAFTVANTGIQVMGGYGYTSDYPIERMARDIRVAAIYEGTSGIQALDFVKRKVAGDQGVVLQQLLTMIDSSLTNGTSPFVTAWPEVRSAVQIALARALTMSKQQSRTVEGGAYASLQLTALALHCWNGHALYTAADDASEHGARLRAALQYFAASVTAKAALWSARAAAEIPDFSYVK
ncbi:MAG TPA: acyl-CoA dehydrogenase family protein [Candidatus Acidoferrum sp.]|nr:acyl-CoA dehydrogenase family protein [Candidatus Acidoferrum sp.]